MLDVLLTSYFFGIAFGSLLLIKHPKWRFLTTYGKLQEDASEKVPKLLRTLHVDRSWFKMFYPFGILVHVVLWTAFSPETAQSSEGSLAAWLFLLHLIRRAAETRKFLGVGKASSMHLAHVMLGLSYYIALPLSIRLCSGFHLRVRTLDLLAIFVYIWASYNQFQTHWILYQLRRSSDKRVRPRGQLFELVACPHYLCELLIYLSLTVCARGALPLVANVVWILVGLGSIAIRTKEFYQELDGSANGPPFAMIPWML